MAKKVLVPIANGTEEIEVVTIVDLLRRAHCEVTLASIEQSKTVVCSRGVVLTADILLDEIQTQNWDMIALAGGVKGAESFADSASLAALLKEQASMGKVAAICAAPALVLSPLGLLDDKRATCHPAFHSRLVAKNVIVDKSVVVDGNVITSQGPGTAMEFSLVLIEQLVGVVAMEEVAAPLVLTPPELAFY